jgi:chromosome segregation ATPase
MKNMINEDQSENEKFQLVEKINELNQTVKENKKNFTDHMKKNEQYINELKELSARNENLQNQKIFYLNDKIDEYSRQIHGLKFLFNFLEER